MVHDRYGRRLCIAPYIKYKGSEPPGMRECKAVRGDAQAAAVLYQF